MKEIGIVLNSEGSKCNILVTDESCELGSIVEIEGHYGIVSQMRYSEDLKVGSRHRLIADIQIFGIRDGERLRNIKKPVKPTNRAYLADEKSLEKILTVDEPISIGLISGTNVRAKFNANEYDRHTAILASTGAGKSYTTANLIKEYAKKNLPILIVDTHGEYSKLLGGFPAENFEVRTFTVKHDRAGYDRLKVPLCGLDSVDFTHFISLSEPQESALSQVIDRLGDKEYTLDDMLEEALNLDANTVHEATQQALSRKLMKLKKIGKGVFDSCGTQMNELVEPGIITIIDASLAGQGIRRSVISYLCREILSERMNHVNEVGDPMLEYPLLFVVEEAHHFAGSSLVHSCKRQLQKIASEGRKFGIGLLVVSQKPSKIDEEILSQCNTGIYMHITNPRDKDHIKKSFECISEDIVRGLDTLDVGECIVAGALVDIPFMMCTVDKIEVSKVKKSKFNFKKKVTPKDGGFNYS